MKQLVLNGEPEEPGAWWPLPPDKAHYLLSVRRLAPGAELPLLAPSGRRWLARLEPLSSGPGLRLLTLAQVPVEAASGFYEPPLPAITLFPALLKGSKLDEVVRQAVELGAVRIVPLVCDHCVSRPEPAEMTRKVQRWNAIAREALQQSGRLRPVQVDPPLASARLGEGWDPASGPLVWLHERPLDTPGLAGYLKPGPQNFGVAVGPEGGFSQREQAMFQERGLAPIWLGSGILRAETASLAALAAVLVLSGDR